MAPFVVSAQLAFLQEESGTYLIIVMTDHDDRLIGMFPPLLLEQFPTLCPDHLVHPLTGFIKYQQLRSRHYSSQEK